MLLNYVCVTELVIIYVAETAALGGFNLILRHDSHSQPRHI